MCGVKFEKSAYMGKDSRFVGWLNACRKYKNMCKERM